MSNSLCSLLGCSSSGPVQFRRWRIGLVPNNLRVLPTWVIVLPGTDSTSVTPEISMTFR